MRTRTRTLTATVAVLAGAVGVFGSTALSASADDEKHLEFVLRFTGENRIDNDGDSQLSVGDTYVALDEVFDSEGRDSVGQLAIDCVIIALPTEDDPTELSRCHGALLHTDGKLLLSTVTTAGELDGRKIDLAVVGGTGRFRAATGDAVNDLTTETSRLIVSLD